jgi:predicted GIY-YIG superfamily endonuclease
VALWQVQPNVAQANRGDAMRREHALKAMTRARKQMLISNFSGDEEAIL